MEYHSHDDAAVVRLNNGKYLVQTVDFFTPVVDDPYQFGQIAAANSLSDIYAMGAQPLFALNVVGFPINQLPREMLTTILQGGADKAAEAGIPIIGGHSVDDPEPKYGLVVTGEAESSALKTNSAARPGDVLVLTKPLGTGIIATAIKKDKISDELINVAVTAMSLLNRVAADIIHQVENVHAVTDITGFGLLGHLMEMVQASKVGAVIHPETINFLPGASTLAERGILPGGTKRNLSYVQPHTNFADSISDPMKYLLADAQTSGGLLLSMPMDDAQRYIEQYNNLDKIPFEATIIGHITESTEPVITVE